MFGSADLCFRRSGVSETVLETFGETSISQAFSNPARPLRLPARYFSRELAGAKSDLHKKVDELSRKVVEHRGESSERLDHLSRLLQRPQPTTAQSSS